MSAIFRNSRGLRGAEKGGLAARRLTPSNALVREEVQPDSGHSTRCVPMSTRLVLVPPPIHRIQLLAIGGGNR
jgi:hypothetical protein